jgi:uncharacterized protein YbjT (DUF2867 family)
VIGTRPVHHPARDAVPRVRGHGRPLEPPRRDGSLIPPLLGEPVAASDVGDVHAEIATGPPQGGTLDDAGPEPQDLVDLARRTLAASSQNVKLVPGWHGGPFSVDMAREVLLSGIGASPRADHL